MITLLLGFHSSIFLITLLGNWLVAFFGVVVHIWYIYSKKHSIVLSIFYCLFGNILGILSIFLFFYSNRSSPFPTENIHAVIVKQIKPNQYIIKDYNDNKGLVTYKKGEFISPGESILFPGYTATLARPIDIGLLNVFPHYLFSREFIYEQWLYTHGYSYSVSPSIIIKQGISSKNTWNDEFSTTIKNRLEKIYGLSDISGLLLGILLGGRAGLSQNSYEIFQKSGLIHIIAVSGSNIMIIGIFLGYILFFIPLRIKKLCIGLGIVLYGIMCGLDASVFRAVLFGVLNLLVIFHGTKIRFLRVVLYSSFILLLINPFLLLYDVGYSLSFGALYGIRVMQQFRLSNSFYNSYILPTLGATVGVLPVIILFFGEFNILSRVATIIVSIFIAPLMFLGIFGLLIPWERIIYVVHKLIQILFIVAEYFSKRELLVSISTLGGILGVLVIRLFVFLKLSIERSKNIIITYET